MIKSTLLTIILGVFLISCSSSDFDFSNILELPINLSDDPSNLLDAEYEFCETANVDCTVVIEFTEVRKLSDNKIYDLLNQPMKIQMRRVVSANVTQWQRDFSNFEFNDKYFSFSDANLSRTTTVSTEDPDNIFIYEIYSLINNIKYCGGEEVFGSCNVLERVENIQYRFRNKPQSFLVGSEKPLLVDLVWLDEGLTLKEISYDLDMNKVGTYLVTLVVEDEYENTLNSEFKLTVTPFEVLFTSSNEFFNVSFNNGSYIYYYDRNLNSYIVLDLDGKRVLDENITQIYKINDYNMLFKTPDGFFKVFNFLSYDITMQTNLNIIPEFSSDKSLVFTQKDEYGVMNLLGEVIIDPKYDLISYSRNYYSILKDGLYGFKSLDGDILREPNYQSILDLRIQDKEYLYLIDASNTVKIVDSNLNIVDNLNSSDLVSFRRDDNRRIALFNNIDNQITDFVYYRAFIKDEYVILYEPFNSRLEGHKSVRNLNGEILLQPQYLDSLDIINHYAILKPFRRDQLVIVNLLNNEIVLEADGVTFEIKNKDPFGINKYLVYRLGNSYNTITFSDGIKVYENAFLYSDGYLQSNCCNNVVIRNTQGKQIFTGNAFNYAGGITTPTKIINLNGEFDRNRSNVYVFDGMDYITLKGISFDSGRKGGIVNGNGTVIVPFVYEEIIVDLFNQIIMVKNSNIAGFLDMEGNEILEISNRNIRLIDKNIYQINNQIVRFPKIG